MKKVIMISSCILMVTACSTMDNLPVSSVLENPSQTSPSETNGQSNQEFEIDLKPIHNNNEMNFNIVKNSDDSLTLGDDRSVPKIFEGAIKYGYIVSQIIDTDKSFTTLVFNVFSGSSDSSMVTTELRVRNNYNQWSEWIQFTPSKRTEIPLENQCNSFQYRMSLVQVSEEHVPSIKINSVKAR